MYQPSIRLAFVYSSFIFLITAEVPKAFFHCFCWVISQPWFCAVGFLNRSIGPCTSDYWASPPKVGPPRPDFENFGVLVLSVLRRIVLSVESLQSLSCPGTLVNRTRWRRHPHWGCCRPSSSPWTPHVPCSSLSLFSFLRPRHQCVVWLEKGHQVLLFILMIESCPSSH